MWDLAVSVSQVAGILGVYHQIQLENILNIKVTLVIG